MEPTKPKLPSEAIELYNLFIHGVISRRAFMDADYPPLHGPDGIIIAEERSAR